MKVFIFTWNTQSFQFDKNYQPTFLEELRNLVLTDHYTLAVFAFQEEAGQSQLLSYIEGYLKYKYDLVDVAQMLGWGVTTLKRLQVGEYVPRGLRLAIFKRIDTDLQITRMQSCCLLCPSLRDWITWGKGAALITLETNLGVITFMNVHLPFYSRMEREEALTWQSYCFSYLYKAALENIQPDYLFLMGDLNFRVLLRNEPTAFEVATKMINSPEYLVELLQEADELRIILGYAKLRGELPLLEGINDQGPRFLPTCKLRQGRTPSEEPTVATYKLGTSYQRPPSWCDRILYQAVQEEKVIRCTGYFRWDRGNMNQSDHAAVIGTFMI